MRLTGSRLGLGLLLATGLVVGVPRLAGALAAVDSSCSSATSFQPSTACTIAVGSGSARLLIIVVTRTDAGGTINTPTVSGSASGVVALSTAGTDELVNVYYQIAPAAGSLPVSVSTSGTPQGMSIAAVALTAAAQTSTFGTPATDLGNSTAVSATATTISGRLVLSMAGWQTAGSGRTVTVGGGATQRVNNATGNSGISVSDIVASSTSTAMTWTVSASSSWATVVVQVNPSSTDTTPPSDVTGLTINAASTSQINLDWADATDDVSVTGYSVERSTGGCGSFAVIATPAVSGYSDTGLTGSTLYCYRIKASDGTNLSTNYSSTASTTTLAPQVLFVRFVDQQATDANTETGFNIYRRAGVSGSFALLTTVGASAGTGLTVTVQDSNAPIPTSCYQVTAVNTAGESSILGGVNGVCYTGGGGTHGSRVKGWRR